MPKYSICLNVRFLVSVTFSSVLQCGQTPLSFSSLPFHEWPHSRQVQTPFAVLWAMCWKQCRKAHSDCALVILGSVWLKATICFWIFVFGFMIGQNNKVI